MLSGCALSCVPFFATMCILWMYLGYVCSHGPVFVYIIIIVIIIIIVVIIHT
jgi:hypothetical protein